IDEPVYLRMSQTIARPIDELFAAAGRLDEYRPYQTIATDDIGTLVALAYDRPEDFIGYELEIAANGLTIRAGGRGFRTCARRRCQVPAPVDAHCPSRARQGVLSNGPLVQRQPLPSRRQGPACPLSRAAAPDT